jgi:peptidoglycan hydrolase CwlO-like protein
MEHLDAQLDSLDKIIDETTGLTIQLAADLAQLTAELRALQRARAALLAGRQGATATDAVAA